MHIGVYVRTPMQANQSVLYFVAVVCCVQYNNYASVRMHKRYSVCLSVCVECYSCSRINEVIV